jgi:hypothetical protein
MRYKKFQISGAIELDEIDTLWITDIDIVDGSILEHDRVPEEALEGPGHHKGLYEFLKVDKYLYKRVDAGSDIDEDYGNATRYYYVLPETHPGFNFDVIYKASEDDIYMAFFNGPEEREDDARTVLHRYLPEFVNRNTYE